MTSWRRPKAISMCRKIKKNATPNMFERMNCDTEPYIGASAAFWIGPQGQLERGLSHAHSAAVILDEPISDYKNENDLIVELLKKGWVRVTGVPGDKQFEVWSLERSRKALIELLSPLPPDTGISIEQTANRKYEARTAEEWLSIIESLP